MLQGEPIRKRSAGGKSGSKSGGGSSPGSTRQEIPDKLYFRIGEVAKLCGVPAYVLRFWEGEFPQLKPNKGGTGQRLYRRRDVEMALRIKTLLYDEGYTIPGARQAFKAELRAGRDAQPNADGQTPTGSPGLKPLEALRKDLQDLHTLLSKAPTGKPPARSQAGSVHSIRPPRSVDPPPPKPAPPAPMQFPTRPQLLKSRPLEAVEPSLFDFLLPDA